MKTARGRAAFTLIELLVVIGIIAILLALLVPSLSGMRDKANRLKCMSNVRQLALAAIHYAGDHSGALPYPNWNNAIGTQPGCPPGWAFDAHNKLTATNTDGALWPYLKDHRIYHCPNDRSPFTPTASANLKFTSYVMNGAVGGFSTTIITSLAPYYALNYSMFKPGDALFWEGSTSSMASSGDLSSHPSEGMTYRHNSGATYGCMDGHAEWISSNDYAKVIGYSGRNAFWCNPKTDNGH